MPTSNGDSNGTSNGTSTSASHLSMEALLSQASTLASTASESTRKKLIDSLRDLAISLEHPQDTTQRLLYTQFELMALRIGCDLDLFNILTSSPTPLSIPQICSKIRTSTSTSTSSPPSPSPKLLGRILRYMASKRHIVETAPDTFAANHVTRTFTNPGFAGGVYHYFDFVDRGVMQLPEYLRARGYANPEDATDTAVLRAFDAPKGMGFFPFFQTWERLFKHFNEFMVVQRLGMPTWLDAYPYKAAAAATAAAALDSPERVFFVDIGGGFGHMSIALRDALPELRHRIIVQDIPATLDAASISHAGVEVMVQDVWEEQQVKGAKIYYMRNIIHDYPDEQAVKILRRTKEALGLDSVILIDDMFLDSMGQHWQACQVDITMMVALAATERTAPEWHELVSKAGLRIRKVYRYTESLQDSIIECVPADREEEG